MNGMNGTNGATAVKLVWKGKRLGYVPQVVENVLNVGGYAGEGYYVFIEPVYMLKLVDDPSWIGADRLNDKPGKKAAFRGWLVARIEGAV